MINNPIKINPEKRLLFASDFHYNHLRDFVFKPRGFNSYQEHDKFIEEQCSSLTENDILVYLGDFSLNSTDEKTLNLLRMINCPVFYIFGNHESVMLRIYKNSLRKELESINSSLTQHLQKDARIRYNIFPFTMEKQTLTGKLGNPPSDKLTSNDIIFLGEEEMVSYKHVVYHCRHMATLIWDCMKRDGQYAVCGHSHGNCALINKNAENGRIMDVGVDNAMKHNGTAFLSADEIHAILKNKEIKIFDHHGDEHA